MGMVMKRTKPKKKLAKPKSVPRLVRSDELCKRLVAIAAFHIDDPKAQATVYRAVRQLQLLDAAAVKAGILTDDQ